MKWNFKLYLKLEETVERKRESIKSELKWKMEKALLKKLTTKQPK